MSASACPISFIFSACSRGHKATALQRFDEMETQKILSMPRFVPFIQINGHSNIEMQAYQACLKIRECDN